MKNITKAIIGIAVVAGAALVAKKVVDSKKEYHKVNTPKHSPADDEKTSEAFDDTEETTEDQSTLDKIKEAATKKVIQILTFAADHEKEMTGVKIALGLVTAGLGLVSASKKVFAADTVKKQYEDLAVKIDSLEGNMQHLFDDGYYAGAHEMFEQSLGVMHNAADDDADHVVTFTNKAGELMAKFVVTNVVEA